MDAARARAQPDGSRRLGIRVLGSNLIRMTVPYVHPVLWNTDWRLKRAVWGRIFCSNEHRFVYFRIPKAANSTVALSLAAAMEAAGRSPSRGLRKTTGHQFLASGIVRPGQFAAYTTFAFVRNPFSRTLSAYLDKVGGVMKKSFRRDLAIGAGPVSFREFLERLDAGRLHANIHWAPQTSIIPIEPARLDYIGRVETIAADLPELLGRIFGPGEHRVIPVVRHATGASQRLSEAYGKAEVRLVRQLYAADFKAFYPDAPDPI
jgi:hypothetical protein